jgi:ribonuclease T1
MLKKYTWVILIAAFTLVFWLGQRSGRQQENAALPAPAASEIGGQNLPNSQAKPARDSDKEADSQIKPDRKYTKTSENSPSESGSTLPGFLPREAKETLQLIASDGPFPHRQDGVIFQNREKRLPKMPRGYYHEYTVETPGLSHRGAKRIVTGGDPIEVYYYTDDHYDSFRRFEGH